jgi:hypothetical protein
VRNSRLLAVGIGLALITVSLLGQPVFAQQPATGSASSTTTSSLGHPCNLLHDLVPTSDTDPTPVNPPKLTPLLAQELIPGKQFVVDHKIKDKILASGLPCQETVSGSGGETKTVLENRQRGFDFYSWLTFIALNSPADKTPIAHSRPDIKAKWEDKANFMQLLNVMVKDPEKNTPEWGKRTIPQECRSRYKDIKNIDDMMVIEMIEETFNEPFKTGPLIDQQGNYALFDILMNHEMFQYMLDNKLYSKKAQQENATLRVDFPSGINPDKGKTEGGDPGAIMIKVSWRVIDSEKDKQKFHTADALILMPRHDDKSEPPCLRKTLGLVGFHVGHKTVSRRQWIWTSFEHIDNVPEDKEIANARMKPSYNFYNPKCDAQKCPVNQTPPHPWDPTYSNGLKFGDTAFKSQISRVVPLTDETKDLNKRFQAVLGDTVWKNYMLLTTQWPSGFPCSTEGDPNDKITPADKQPTDFKKQPDMNCAPAPTFLANSTLETYSQGKDPLASSSCMSCHGNAVSHQRHPADFDARNFFNQSDFTFMLEKAR